VYLQGCETIITTQFPKVFITAPKPRGQGALNYWAPTQATSHELGKALKLSLEKGNSPQCQPTGPPEALVLPLPDPESLGPDCQTCTKADSQLPATQ
jgi:hypothetical protein